MSDSIHKVVIIGSGPAGYTAGIYASRSMLEPLLISGRMFGGQLMTTSHVENFPGYPSGVSGQTLMSDLHEQAKNFGTKFLEVDITNIDTTTRPFVLTTDVGSIIKTQSIILATGASAIWLNAEGENKLRSRGVSTCAVCDGAFFKNEHLLVVGGGDSAMEEAIFLTRYASKVTIIHRRDNFRASKIMITRAQQNDKIDWKTNCHITKWITDSGVLTGALLTFSDGHIEEIKCGGAFIAIGHKPNTDFLSGSSIELDKDGYIQTKINTMTNIPGIFACGDAVDSRYRQAITAAGQGCMAAIDCEKWLS